MSKQMIFNDMERWLLNRIQYDFPIVKEPYKHLAAECGASQIDIFQSVKSMREKGIIRRIGASYVPRQLGYFTTLVSARVAPDALENAASCAANFPEVTHNYERLNSYNLWFTVIASSVHKLEFIIAEVAKVPGVEEIHALPTCKTFKLKVKFQFDGISSDFPSGCQVSEKEKAVSVSKEGQIELHKPLIAKTCGDIGQGMMPYCDLSRDIGMDCDELLGLLQTYKTTGIMRRFGAILQHQIAGFNGNAMVVWQVPEHCLDDIGGNFATLPEVSHCYQRRTFNDWPFNLYTMVHGRNHNQVKNLCKNMAQKLGIYNYQLLFSGHEFKKTSMVYFPEEA